MAILDRPDILGPGPYWRSVVLKGEKVASTTPCCDTEVCVPVRDMEVLGELTVNCPGDGRLWLFRWDPWLPRAQDAWID